MTRLQRLFERAGNMKERALHRIIPSRMNVISYTWPLAPDICPCDVHFCDYLRDRNVRGKAIFHFGTGGHHLVGLRNRDDGLENEILGITASPGEHARYVRQLVWAPSLGRHYRVLFADIYDLAAASLPSFDLVTLFHLCEFTPPPEHGRRWDDAGVLELMLSKLTPGGRLLLYRGSYGFRRALPLVEREVAGGRLSLEEEFRSIVVYRR
jgi:SAM-dependent methyltransferase